MTSRLASLASLAWSLSLVSACGSLDAGDRTPTATDEAGAGGTYGASGTGGRGDDGSSSGMGGSGVPNGTGGASSGPAGAGGNSPGGGDSGVGAGGSEGAGQNCPVDTNGSDLIDCDDAGQLCACPGGEACDVACAGAQMLHAGQTCREFSLAGRALGKQPACALSAKLGPSMAFSFAPAKAGWVRFTVTPKQGDILLSATTGECGQVTKVSKDNLCRNEVGVGGVETVLVPVTGDRTVTLLVTGATSQDASARFDVATDFLEPECGNGLLDEGEVCDDGTESKACASNCTSFLGCMDATALADASGTSLEAAVASAALAGDGGAPLSSCVTVGAKVQRTIYALRAAHTGQLEARLRSPDGGDLALSVRSSCGPSDELGCSDRQGPTSGSSTEERLSLPVTVGQTYYLVVEGYGAGGASYELSARTLPAACGDGIVAPSVEQCDPGGGVTADTTCEPTCTRQTGAGDDAKAPVTVKAGESVDARIVPAGDVDEYMLVAEAPVRVSVAEVGGDDCAGRRLDSQLTVLNPQGQVVAFSDDAQTGDTVAGYCSEVTLPKGSYRVRVRSSEASAPSQVFSYRLRVADLTTP